jgi:hypothetical protein
MPPIIHNLKAFGFHSCVAADPLSTLTLPCLQEVEISNSNLAQLPALVRRSSCPLTRLTLHDNNHEFPHDDPLPGVTDLFVESLDLKDSAMTMKFLLDGSFPDLRYLTLQLQPFEVLWNIGAIPLLLDQKRSRPDGRRERRFDKFIVVDEDQVFNWDSDTGEKLKELDVTLRENGFEFF